MIALIGGGALLFLGLVVGGVVFALMPRTPKTAVVPANPTADTLVKGDPQTPPEVKQEEPKPLPAALAPVDLQRVKQSTVYLRVEMPSGGVAEGTGFFAIEPGVIVTNAHVLGMLTPDSLAPKSVIVKVHHGESNEFQVNGLVLGVDRTNDLAVLRTDAASSPLPPPLQVDSASNLIETQKVWIFGFPLGTALGKNITVSDSSVSSLRKDASGVINQVQVNGGMQPGNSGGPVTDSRGVVVGVSVSIIQGTQLNFAIPGDLVTRVLAGGISEQDFGTPYSGAGGRATVPVRLRTLDPLQRVREVKVDVWTGPAGATQPATDKEPQSKPGDGPRQRVAATAKDGGFTADIPLPPLPPGQVYWSQPLLVNASGVTTWAAANTVPFDPNNVIERRQAQLQFKAPTAPIERTLHVTSNKTINVFGLDEPLTMSNKMDGYVLESSAPDKQEPGTRSHLRLNRPRFTREVGGKILQAPDVISGTIANLSPSYLVAPNHSVSKFTRPGLNSVPPDSQEMIGDLFDTVCNAYEVTTIPLPNRMVQPQESWPARVPMLISTGPPRQEVRIVGKRKVVRTVPSKKEVRALNLTCTYEGTRTVNGVHQGYVVLTGVVNGNGPKAKEIYGKVSGHALVNLDSGMLSQVKTTISLEMESENPGVRILVTDDSVIDRVEGNTQNIKIPLPPPPVVKKEVPAGWKEYKPKNGAFLPDSVGESKENNPIVQPKKIPTLRLNVTELTAEAKGGPTYTASVIDANPLTALAVAGKGTTSERIDWFRDFLQESANGKISGQKPIKLGRLEGKEFLIERPKGVTRYRVYMFVNKYFMVSVTGTKAQVESKDALTFLDSYTIPIAFTGVLPNNEKDKGK